MSLSFNNPFADSGGIVHSERFIGRQASLQVLENRIIHPVDPGNLAIIGDHKIGKSSLVYKAIIERRNQFLDRRIVPIWINLAIYDQPAAFFRSLVTRCCDEIEDLEWLSAPIRQAADRALDNELAWSESYSRIQRFFEKVRQSKIRIIFILDEFDHARDLFKGNISGFQGLRELYYRPEARVTFITTSRRTILDIERQTEAISTFNGIFRKHYLGMFDATGLQEYFARLSSLGILVNDHVRQQINDYCGGHPFLLQMLGYEIVEDFRERQNIDVEKAAQRIQSLFLDQYDRMTNLLRQDGSLNKLLQILFGPVVDVRRDDVNRLLRYGLIKEGINQNRDRYVAYSPHFQTYLNLINRQVELWPIWRTTELAIRNLITTKMLEKHGTRWISKLEKSRPNLQNIFKRCREAQNKERNSFENRASENLIDFTYPSDLFAIMFAEWDVFQAILGQNKEHWNHRSRALAQIRNPLAHNRDGILHEYEKQIAEGYCKEILNKIEA